MNARPFVVVLGGCSLGRYRRRRRAERVAELVGHGARVMRAAAWIALEKKGRRR